MLLLHEIIKQATTTAEKNGFVTHDPTTIERKLLLAVGELVEAQNELRDGHGHDTVFYENSKPCGFVSELADTIIRVCQLAGEFNLPLEQAIFEKMAYNDSRPYKHGKQF